MTTLQSANSISSTTHRSGVSPRRIVVAGASGFVGRHLCTALAKRGHPVKAGSRDPRRARRVLPAIDWVHFNTEDKSSLRSALRSCDTLYYLIHGMGSGDGYERAELRAARRTVRAAAVEGIKRIIYLGGIAPEGLPSRHLRSRITTGRILRSGPTPCIELRATMIVGYGSASWGVMRDLAARLPVLLCPDWMRFRSQPIDIRDVVSALIEALRAPLEGSCCHDLPGPERMTLHEILARTAALLGMRPHWVPARWISHDTAAACIPLLARANRHITEELVFGITGDLLSRDRYVWETWLPEHPLVAFDDAARHAIAQEKASSPVASRLLESILQSLSRVM